MMLRPRFRSFLSFSSLWFLMAAIKSFWYITTVRTVETILLNNEYERPTGRNLSLNNETIIFQVKLCPTTGLRLRLRLGRDRYDSRNIYRNRTQSVNKTAELITVIHSRHNHNTTQHWNTALCRHSDTRPNCGAPPARLAWGVRPRGGGGRRADTQTPVLHTWMVGQGRRYAETTDTHTRLWNM